VGPVDGRRSGSRDLVPLAGLVGRRLWLSSSQTACRRDRRWRQGAPAVISPSSRSAQQVDTSRDPACRVPIRDGEVAVAGDAASTAWLPKVGDAGNGYPALPWTVLVRVRARAWMMAGGKVAVGRTVKAGRSGVEVPAGAR
jgi:hypothetical protein